MTLLILGILLWSGAHLVPSVAAEARAGCIERIGEGPYKGLFSLSLVAAIVLMALGWRSTTPEAVYAAPAWGASLTNIAMLVSLVLFMGSNVPTNLKRFVRHPQLTGVAVWSLAHLLSNGDLRSIVLFGGLGLWAVVEIFTISRREGAWEKPEALPLAAEVKPLVAGIIGYVVFALLHPYIAGVSPFPG
jgi:uncharacterized membrane protein